MSQFSKMKYNKKERKTKVRTTIKVFSFIKGLLPCKLQCQCQICMTLQNLNSFSTRPYFLVSLCNFHPTYILLI